MSTDETQNLTGPERARKLFTSFPYKHPQGRLRERVKELHCLYSVLELTSDKEEAAEAICAKVLEALLPAFLHEARTVVRIRLRDFDLQSANWQAPALSIDEPILCERAEIGIVSVGYVNPDEARLEFLPEEYDLMAAVAANLGKMTEDRMLLERTRQAEKVRASAEMAGVLAHDFNNLLTVILGSAESLLEDVADGHPSQDHLQLIADAAERGSALIAQLLADIRNQPLSPAAIATAPMLRALERLLVTALGSAIRFELDVPEGTWPIYVDRAQLENALLNLAINARDAMPDGGRFSICASNRHVGPDRDREESLAEGDYVCLEVKDNGAGMPPAIASRAFDPFFSAKEHGTGLGLSSVSGFVNQSRGSIRLLTEQGRGTTFVMCLPRAPDALLAGAN